MNVGFWTGATGKSRYKWMQHKLSPCSTTFIRRTRKSNCECQTDEKALLLLSPEQHTSSSLIFTLFLTISSSRLLLCSLYIVTDLFKLSHVFELSQRRRIELLEFKWWVTLETRNQIRPFGSSVERHLPNISWIKSMSSASFPSRCRTDTVFNCCWSSISRLLTVKRKWNKGDVSRIP